MGCRLRQCFSRWKEPTFLRRVHAAFGWFWAINMVGAALVYALDRRFWDDTNILYISEVTLLGMVIAHWGSWQTSRTEETGAMTPGSLLTIKRGDETIAEIKILRISTPTDADVWTIEAGPD